MLLLFAFPIGIYSGWALGANDAANFFGTGVMARAVKFRTAVILFSIFAILGAVLEGQKTTAFVGQFTQLDIGLALLCAISSASVVAVMTYLRLPVSTSQACLGGVMGVALYTSGLALFPWDKLLKALTCWVTATLGAMALAFALYRLMDISTRRIKSLPTFTLVMSIGIMVAGAYGAYTLGANNIANTTGVFVGAGTFTPLMGALVGGGGIALGACTYSKRVMETVGGRITGLDIPAAFVAILAEAIILHIYAHVGVPVSASEAIVGAVMGIGLSKGMRAINRETVTRILIGWILNLFVAMLIPYLFLLLVS